MVFTVWLQYPIQNNVFPFTKLIFPVGCGLPKNAFDHQNLQSFNHKMYPNKKKVEIHNSLTDETK